MSLNFDYNLRRSTKSHRLKLTVYADGKVVISAPLNTTDRLISNFVNQYTDWIQTRLQKIKLSSPKNLLPGGRQNYIHHKEQAKTLALALLKRHNSHYDLKYNRVTIKNLYRNWGSCSIRKNLNYNYKIVHLPLPLAEYIIVHELCHLAEMNHSKRFWLLVAQTIPDYKKRRQALQNYLM